ncbi:MAG TPA: tetratricopeptide repeat protein [Thermoanaerobaculia bacterium]|nr:tetratricopeptide repeat protein [Thermoanaerobaculia bacterium]
MKRIALVLFFAFPLFAHVSKLVDEGIKLYDAGRYDEAIVKLKAALAEDPSSDHAAYELGLTYSAKGDTAACIALFAPRVKAKKNEYRSAMYGVLGNCYDNGGDPERAVATYRQGLKVDGNDTQLLYNLSVTLVKQGELEEARKLLKKELALQPWHPSGHWLLGHVFESQNFRVPAVLSYLRFLALEPTGERAKDAASRMLALLGAGVEVKDAKNITINIDPKPRKEEGDYAAVELMLSMAGAAKALPEEAAKSEFERKRGQVATALAMIVEGEHKGRDHTATQVIPFFRKLHDQELLDTYAGIALVSLKLPGTQEWAKANDAEVDQYLAFMRAEK